MQRPLIFFISLFFALSVQSIDSHAQDLFTSKADSLFLEKKYSEAALLYQELLEKHSINRSNAFLKLAYINEQNGNFPKAIYYLSEYFNLNPSESTFSKINKMAEENSFSGYSRSDLNFLLLLYERYFLWISMVIFLLVAYSFFVLVSKRFRGEYTALRHKVAFVLFVLASLLFLNIQRYYKHGIVREGEVFIRTAPSSGAAISQTLGEGSRVNILGEKDIWLRLFLNGKVQFAKKSDFWIIDED